jgi:redox-sensing transcriptional repressor
MHQEGKRTTSSKELGERIGISAAQIRKDLSQFGEFGKQGTGYSIHYLLDELQKILNVDRVWDMALVGAGDLGHAIAHYQGFANRGFRVTKVFDNDPNKVGLKVGDFIVEDTANLIKSVQAAGIQVAMLTVPAAHAQQVAEELVKAGIKAILNYTPTPLNLPRGVHIEQIDPLIQLQHMTYYLDE